MQDLCCVADEVGRCPNPRSFKDGTCQKHRERFRRHGIYGPALGRFEPASIACCSVPECGRAHKAKGFCLKHYERFQKSDSTELIPRPSKRRPCSVEGCVELHFARTYCKFHHGRYQRQGADKVVTLYPTPVTTYRNKRGYVLLKIDHSEHAGHPNACRSGKYIFEHRLVMSQMLGRPLLDGENVHHINGVKSDNRPENLELWTVVQPAGQRVTDRLEHAAALLLQYAGDPKIWPSTLENLRLLLLQKEYEIQNG